MIPKPNKPDRLLFRAYRLIALLLVLGKGLRTHPCLEDRLACNLFTSPFSLTL